jgi:hypothetical protein
MFRDAELTHTLCLPRSSFERGADIILRRTDEGAPKCALWLLRRDEEVSVGTWPDEASALHSISPEAHPKVDKASITEIVDFKLVFPPKANEHARAISRRAAIRLTGIELHLEDRRARGRGLSRVP